MPHRCVRCNEPAAEPTKARRIYWHNPWLYVLVLVNLIIYVVVAAIVRKKATVAPGLCSAHKRRRYIGIGIAWALLLAGVALLFMGKLALVGGVLLIPIGLLVCVSATRIVRASRIDAQYIRLKGCSSAFLDSMPPFPG